MNQQIGYIYFMDKGPIANYFERNYLDYQKKHGRLSLTKWAEILKFSKGFLNQLMSGRSKSMTYHTARYVADVLNDYEILEILDYPIPPEEERNPFFGFPPEIIEALRSARDNIATLGIADNSPEGKAMYNSAIEKVLKNRTTNNDESDKT